MGSPGPRSTVELGTIIIAGAMHPDMSGEFAPGGGGRNHSSLPRSYPVALWDLLGKSVLRRIIDRLQAAGEQLVSVVPAEGSSGVHEEAWERTFVEYARSGVERILLVSLGAYSEFQLNSLLEFHRASECQVTNLADEQGPLGISLIEAKCADGGPTSLRNRLSAFSSCSSTYEFTGYSNLLADPADYRRLVQDALAGRCEIKPVGQEIRPGIWCGNGARVSALARVLAPAYLGLRARVRAGALIASGTSIEERSEVDCGTVVQNSSVLPRTYLGPGLHVSQSVVSGSRLVHLTRKIDVELAHTGLLSRKGPNAPSRVLESLSAFFGAFGADFGPGVSTPSRTPASVDWVRSNGFFG
jgi:hypothetical protein